MTLTELLLILLVLTLVLFFLRMSRQRKKNALYARLDFLRPAQKAGGRHKSYPLAGAVQTRGAHWPPQAWLFLWPWPFSLTCRSGVWCCCSASFARRPGFWFVGTVCGAFGRSSRERFPEAVDSLTRAVQAGVPLERPWLPSGPSLRVKWPTAFSTWCSRWR